LNPINFSTLRRIVAFIPLPSPNKQTNKRTNRNCFYLLRLKNLRKKDFKLKDMRMLQLRAHQNQN
jgi:hypothetical protein